MLMNNKYINLLLRTTVSIFCRYNENYVHLIKENLVHFKKNQCHKTHPSELP